ncbi:MAG: hypothetical protein WDN31_00680 [Hyphomicrobium sp.]
MSTGAYQAWARDFGQVCPAPDFEGARTFWQRRVTTWAAQIAGSISRHVPLAIAVVVLLATAAWGGRRLLARRSRNA